MNEEKKNIKFIPEININDSQVEITNIVWPISGWKISKRTTGNIIIKLTRYLR
mgnify:CR=1 FL=1